LCSGAGLLSARNQAHEHFCSAAVAASCPQCLCSYCFPKTAKMPLRLDIKVRRCDTRQSQQGDSPLI
jgi:hypothetical protein